jgi:hypothetical protein
VWSKAARIASFEPQGLILRRGRSRFAVAYGEIMTTERLRSIWGLRLHTRSGEPLRLPCRGAARTMIEDELRQRGVLVVDCWGAIISPTLADFEKELDRQPVRVRQSSDSA